MPRKHQQEEDEEEAEVQHPPRRKEVEAQGLLLPRERGKEVGMKEHCKFCPPSQFLILGSTWRGVVAGCYFRMM